MCTPLSPPHQTLSCIINMHTQHRDGISTPTSHACFLPSCLFGGQVIRAWMRFGRLETRRRRRVHQQRSLSTHALSWMCPGSRPAPGAIPCVLMCLLARDHGHVRTKKSFAVASFDLVTILSCSLDSHALHGCTNNTSKPVHSIL